MSRIVQTFSTQSPQWPTLDPFLFVAHHDDTYPVAKGDTMTPDASLAGREIGADFAGRDGWNMYHGDTVPGFPQHPHRGFETVTVVEEGLVDHTDSAGAVARYGRGDTQWLTAGSGVAHAEMFPLVDDTAPNPLHLFQIWLNLAPEDKSAPANFEMFWADDTPVVETTDAAGRRARVKVVAGEFAGTRPLTPPPASWAARPDADVAIWRIDVDADATVTLPATRDERTIRTLYVYRGALVIDGETLRGQGAVVDAATPLDVTATGEGASVLVLQGRPIGAPVAKYGPFVGNTQADLVRAFDDYNNGVFGAWPHATNDPVQPRDAGRFARYPDGRVITPGA